MYCPNRSVVVFLSFDDDQGRAGERQACGAGERLKEVVAQVARLRAVGLVDHQQDAFRAVHKPKDS